MHSDDLEDDTSLRRKGPDNTLDALRNLRCQGMKSDKVEAEPFVSVIIPVYNDVDRLTKCLKALSFQTYFKDCYEVIVVDNGSSENLETVQCIFQDVLLLKEDRPGSYCARNRGIESAKGEILAFTDSDCIPDIEWIEKGVHMLVSTPNCGLVGGKIELFFKDPESPLAVEIYESVHAFNQKNMIENYQHCTTANLFTFKKVFDDVGFFNDTLKSGGDVDWGKRVYSNGYKQIYAENACVAHPARYTFGELYKKTARVVGGVYEMKMTERYSTALITKDVFKLVVSLIALVKRSFFNISPFQNMNSYRQRLQYITVAAFVSIVKIFERVRLQSGGSSRR